MGKIYTDYLAKSISFWKANSNNYSLPQVHGKKQGYEVATFNSTSKTSTPEQKDGLVIMGFNPSGAYPSSIARTQLSPTFFEWDSYKGGTKAVDPYTQAVDQFAIDCEFQHNNYKLDAFGLLSFTQKSLEQDIINNTRLYTPMFGLPISSIVQLSPKVILFVNGGLRRLLIDNGLFKEYVNQLQWDQNKCAYKITLSDCNGSTIVCYGIFTTMLSGGHLDKGSREVLVQVIKNL